MKMFMTSVALAGLSLSAPLASAQPGTAGWSCGAWIEAEAGSNRSRALEANADRLVFVLGYLTGAAYHVTQTVAGDMSATERKAFYHTQSGLVLDVPELPAVRQWLTSYCQSHPLDSVVTASGNLVNELLTRTAQRTAPKER